MIQYKKILMTLALLLTAVTGAWADEPKVYTTAVDVTSLKVGDILAQGFSLTSTNPNGAIFNIADQRGKRDETIHPGGYGGIYTKNITAYGANATFTTADGTYYPIDENGNVGNAWVVTQECNQLMDMDLKIAGVTIEPPLTVAWDPATKTGTFSMPGSNVVLTPIYAAATVYGADGQTEKGSYETFKEAFAAVQDGDVITLDWNVTLTETLKTPSTASDISFTLDFNGFVIDNTGGNNYLVIDNGYELTLTDNSTAQTGGLKCQFPIMGTNGGKVIFQGGRYSFNGCTAEQIASGWDEMASNSGWVMGDGKEFVNIENAPVDGFMVRVDYKAFELTIGAGRFATFYADQNTTLDEGQNIGFYTISNISDDRTKANVTPINSTIIPANTPTLVYNSGDDQQTVKLKVTTDAVNLTVDYVEQFKGDAKAHEFTADDMAAADYYALSGGKAFARVRSAGTLSANQCWLQFDKQQVPGARSITLVFEGSVTTGIGEIEDGRLNIENEAGAVYDLQGRRMESSIFNSQSSIQKKGVYIQNGKKVVK